jgi:hypothetical protein
MRAVRLGMQPRPRPHAHRAILSIRDREVILRQEPGLRRITGELVAVTAGTAGPWLHRWVGREATPGPQANQHGSRRVPQRLGELDRIVAGVEEEPRQRIIGLQVWKESRDLLGSDRIGILLWTEPPHA